MLWSEQRGTSLLMKFSKVSNIVISFSKLSIEMIYDIDYFQLTIFVKNVCCSVLQCVVVRCSVL